MSRRLTDDQRAEITRLHESGLSRNAIRIRTGRDPRTINRVIDHAYRDRSHTTGLHVRPENRVPPSDLAARRREIPEDTRSLTAALCGDPLPGRRAIDREAPS